MIRSLLQNQKNHSRIAVIERDQAVLCRDIALRAQALRRRMPQGRETIAVLLPNGSDYIAALWGVIESGHLAFPLNALLTGHEMVPLLRHASASVIIASQRHRSLLEETVAPQLPRIEIVYVESVDAAGHGEALAPVAVKGEDAMLLLATSGTTDECKIVRLSEENIAASVLGQLEKLRLSEAELRQMRLVLTVPFWSIYGIMELIICLMHAIPIVLLDDAFTLDALFMNVQKHRVTHYEGSATAILLMEQLAGRPIPYDISALTYFGFGGSKVSGDTIRKVLEAYPGIELSQGYGMTEAAPMIAKHPRGKPCKPESVGSAIRGMDIAVQTETGIVREPYVKGEIIVQGKNVMLGYHNNDAETARALRGGFLHTGDIGYLDDEGYLYICGRKKNVIIVRGFNVYPEEVEACIQSSLLVKECAVYGRMDADGNEMVCADVVPMRPEIGADAIRRHASAHLAAYKQPEHITICGAVRRNKAGKIARRGGMRGVHDPLPRA